MLVAKHVLHYLGGFRLLALCLGTASSTVPESLCGYMQNMGCSDADWAYPFYFFDSLISWSAVKQKSIALSLTEADYYAMSHAFKEALWLWVFLNSLFLSLFPSFLIIKLLVLFHFLLLFQLALNINICHHFIRAHVQDGSFTTIWIPTVDMPANIFTKPLNSILFSQHQNVLGLSIPSF